MWIQQTERVLKKKRTRLGLFNASLGFVQRKENLKEKNLKDGQKQHIQIPISFKHNFHLHPISRLFTTQITLTDDIVY